MNLRDRIGDDSILLAPGVADPFAALLVQHLGFEAAYLGGNALGLALGKGQPFVDRREVVEAVGRITGAVDIPLIVDAATGFGDPAHAFVAVREIESAGAAAVHIDDQIFPKRAHYHRGVTQLADPDEVAARLDQAVQARRSSDCMIIARSDVLRVDKPLEQHLPRLRKYADIGIDGLLVLGSTIEDARLLRREFPRLTLLWTATLAGSSADRAELEASDFGVALYPFHGVGAVTAALRDVWTTLKETGRPGAFSHPPKELVEFGLDLVGMNRAWDIEERTLGPFHGRRP